MQLLLLLVALLLELAGRSVLALRLRSKQQFENTAAWADSTTPFGNNFGQQYQHNIVYFRNSRSSVKGFGQRVAGSSVWTYLSLPYAEPPVGNLRFKSPQPYRGNIGSFRSPYNATVKPPTCYYWPLGPSEFEVQNAALKMWWNNTVMSEDCLYLNVWTVARHQKPQHAVMIWIYGGGYFGGSASLEVYDGAALAAKGGVVVASMQYRTGALGFLHLHETDAPGNVGLEDQALAIKWIHDNIDNFGGDNRRVTLFGESAGAVSVTYHMQYEDSKQYFQRAIMQSGTALAWWASEPKLQAKRKALQLAGSLGCYIGKDRSRIVDCMRHVSVEKIQHASNMVLSLYNNDRLQLYRRLKNSLPKHGRNTMNNKIKWRPTMYFNLPFRPVRDSAFIPKHAEDMMDPRRYKDVDMLMGVVKDEGIFWIVYALVQIFNPKNWQIPFWWGNPIPAEFMETYRNLKRTQVDFDRDPFELVARYFITNRNMHRLLTEAVAFEYQVPSTRLGFRYWRPRDVADAFDDLTGDKTFKCPTIDFADIMHDKLRRANKKIWMYSFEHHSHHLPLPKWTGAMHGYEIDYVFGMPFNKRFTSKFYNFTHLEQRLSDKMIKFWSDFAKTGNPNQPEGTLHVREKFVVWPEYKLENRSHIILKPIEAYQFEVGKNLRRRQCRFWRYHVKNIRRTLSKARVSTCLAQARRSPRVVNLPTGAAQNRQNWNRIFCLAALAGMISFLL